MTWFLAGVGLALVAVTMVDLFLAVFNYDGFTFLAGRLQRSAWAVVRTATAWLPERSCHAARSIGSALMLPGTVLWWLAGEVVGFALVYDAGLHSHGFVHAARLAPDLATALYVSAGTESTLTFGDVVGRAGPEQAAMVLQAVAGLATFTLALGYVVTTFGVLEKLDALHNTVRRHAADPDRPASVLTRHFHGGAPTELPALLQVLSADLEGYDEGLRRYPVAYYVHTRRLSRSVPNVFRVLGLLLAQLRFGLPADEPLVDDPWLGALIEQYQATVDRLRRSFVGPDPPPEPTPLDEEAFRRAWGGDGPADPRVTALRDLQRRARRAAGRPDQPDDAATAYPRYRQWLPFAQRREVILERVADRLGYTSTRRR